MKKLTIAAVLAASTFAGAAAAAEQASATMVFEGYVPSVTPSETLTITGVGGAPLARGTLSISTEGQVTTSVPVLFEVRRLVPGVDGGAPTHGDIITTANVKLVNSTLTAGSATVNNTTNEVFLNATEMTQGSAVAATLEQNVVEFENQKVFEVGQVGVGAGAAVQASVVIMVEEPAA